jgi:polyferredoxin
LRFTLLSVLLIGRGVFCGWLCPFRPYRSCSAGSLAGSACRNGTVPAKAPLARQVRGRRGWCWRDVARPNGRGTEIEPFKTAITSKFTRTWPYVLYAGALLAFGLFSERAYCRFLCPLGGLLAFLDRLHLINLLKRRPECGNPCHLCERSCPVRAIEPTGKIVTAECFQCLDCQVEYYDDARCPPLARAAKLRGGVAPTAVTVENA